ncbi:MAG: IPT/TIG domain-containing protein [Desulfuromonadales bacterium]
MNRIIIFSIAAILATVTTGMALEITSVAPNRGAPGSRVVLSGGPFSLQSRIYLGEQFVSATQVLPNQMVFTVPSLPAGSYSLTVQSDDDVAIQAFTFEILAAQPQIVAVTPDNLDFCADEAERLVQIEGRNFLPGALILLNGNAINGRVVDNGHLEFRLPELPAGVYGVEVRNPDGTSSLPHSLWINSVPEIAGVERGDDFVNHYDIIVHGKNFFFNSFLVVKEPENTTVGESFRQLTFHAGHGDLAGRRSIQTLPGEKLLYNDCRTLIYQRYPSSPQDKELTLQVINPDGKKTEPYMVTLP